MIISSPGTPSGLRRTLKTNGENASVANASPTTGANTKTTTILAGATTEVLNLSGSGGLMHLSFVGGSGTVSSIDIDAVIDGKAETVTLTSITTSNTQLVIHSEMRNQTYSSEPVRFDHSFSLSITNNDGADTVQVRYKYFLND